MAFYSLRVTFPRPTLPQSPNVDAATYQPPTVEPAVSSQRMRKVWFLLTAAPALISPPAAPAFDASLVRPVISHQRTATPGGFQGAFQGRTGAFDPALVRPLIAFNRAEPQSWHWQPAKRWLVQPPAAPAFDPALVPRPIPTSLRLDKPPRQAKRFTGAVTIEPELNPDRIPTSAPRLQLDAAPWYLIRSTRNHVQPPAAAPPFDAHLVRPLISGLRVARPEGPTVRYLVGDLRPPAAPFDATAVVRPILSSQLVAVKEGPRVRYLTGDLRPPSPFSAALVRPLIRGLRAERPEQRYQAADLGTTTLLGQEPSGAVAWIEATYRATNLTATYRGAQPGATHRGPNLTRALRATDLTATYRGEPDDATYGPG